MTLPRWIDPKITVGNLITVFALIVAMVSAWSAMGAAIAANTAAIASIRTLEIPAIRDQAAALETNVTALRDQMSSERVRLADLLAEMRTDIRYLRAAVDRLVAESHSGGSGLPDLPSP